MSKQGRFLFLGTGGSMGIPVIGCHCSVCSSSSSFNKRFRPSGLITINERKFLLDCGPDFRLQALSHGIETLDGIFLTHAHQDHISGIDDLRIYCLRSQKPIPCLLSRETLNEVTARFAYLFQPPYLPDQLRVQMKLQLLPEVDYGQIVFEEIPIQFVTFRQAGMRVNGYRFGNLAYLSDIREYSEAIFSHLAQVDILIISALRHTPSPFHFSIDEAISFAQRVGARQTWFTHIAHELDYEATNALLPPNIRLAYDGLTVEFDL